MCSQEILACNANSFAAPEINLFHAGTKLQDGRLVTAGGRVLAVAATGNTLEKAVDSAYEGLSNVYSDGMFYRKDIGLR